MPSALLNGAVLLAVDRFFHQPRPFIPVPRSTHTFTVTWSRLSAGSLFITESSDVRVGNRGHILPPSHPSVSDGWEQTDTSQSAPHRVKEAGQESMPEVDRGG